MLSKYFRDYRSTFPFSCILDHSTSTSVDDFNSVVFSLNRGSPIRLSLEPRPYSIPFWVSKYQGRARTMVADDAQSRYQGGCLPSNTGARGALPTLRHADDPECLAPIN
jgi:hypothetical protein